MTIQALYEKYFAVGHLAEPFCLDNKMTMMGQPAGELNPINRATDAATNDLFLLLRPFFPSMKIVPGSPHGGWGEEFQRVVLAGPQTAHWFEVSGFNKYNFPVTIHILVGPLLNAFSRMEPLGAFDYIIGQINFALQLEPSPTGDAQ